MALSAELQRQVRLRRLASLVLHERIERGVNRRWGSWGGLLEAAQQADPVAVELVELLQRATERAQQATKGGQEWQT